jgi:hypothetical protein
MSGFSDMGFRSGIMRVPHPQNGFIVFRMGIREANAFSHPPTTLSSRPKRSAVERPASLPRRHNPRGRLTQNLSSPHACAKPPKPLPPKPESTSETWRTPPTPTTKLEEVPNPTIAQLRSQQAPQPSPTQFPRKPKISQQGPTSVGPSPTRVKRASTLPKARVQAKPKRQNCLPSQHPKSQRLSQEPLTHTFQVF